ncbi:hypothetical protein [Kineococcus sp. SYSU DK004]|uniref:hypothetical protein n=1 Tax=Kineococcus sp. SYSU DK004 TaxID=3383125 RepID=UPI003D7D1A13
MRRALAAALLSVLPLGALGASAAPASAAPAAGGGLVLRSAAVTTTAPASTRPLDEDCWRGRSGALCGYGVVDVVLGGFGASGGVPDCSPWTEGCEEPVASLVEAAGTRVDVLVRCEGSWLPRLRSVPVTTGPSSLVRSADVTPLTRLDADSARLQVSFPFPAPAQLGCGARPVHVLAAAARSVTVGWAGTRPGVPAGTARVPGAHRFALGG